MGHYLIAPLAARGITCLGLNSRYAGNDTVLLMERVLQDLGAGVKFMRGTLGCERVVLVGNSGGAALAAYYQAEAEQFSAETMVDGDPSQPVAADLPRVDGLALCAAHEGRSHLLLRWIDPAVVDEHDAAGRSIRRSTCTTRANWRRRRRGTAFIRPNSSPASSPRSGRGATASRRACASVSRSLRSDRRARRATSAFVIHRTHADPRCLDRHARRPTIAGRAASGATRARSTARANAMGRTTSLTAFLSQWSSASRAGGPENLARTSLPDAAPHLHRRPEHVPEHARRLARRRRRADPQRRHRRRRPLPRRPRRSAGACRRRDRRLRRGAITIAWALPRSGSSRRRTSCRRWPFVAPAELACGRARGAIRSSSPAPASPG